MPPIRVLLVEDSMPVLEAWVDALNHAGYEVHPAVSGEEAIRELRRRAYDIIVCDYELGGQLSGLDVLAVARTAEPPIPTIVISGQAPDSELHVARQLGAVATLEKPFEMRRLLETIRAALGR